MALDSAKRNLVGLPLELLQHIAGHLNETHRPSLYAFGLASKTCYSAIVSSVFCKIHLRVRNRKALQRDVDSLIGILSRTESARHVRCLSITGLLCLDTEESGESGNKAGASDDDDEAMAWFKRTGIDEVLVGEEPIYSGRHVCYDGRVIKRSSEEDMAWAPVASLIKTLPYLPTLVYNCRNQFPPGLLDALHEHQPQCKLQHLTFRLRSLLSDTPDPYEMALATSQCLYGVKVGCAWRDSTGDDDFNQDAMMELVAGLAPNLEEVQVVNLVAERSWRFPRPRGLWRGLPGFVPSTGLGSLTSLSLVGWVDWSPDLLQAWARHTDFGSLHHLALGGGFGQVSGIDDGIMEWIVQNCSFPRLKTLRVSLDRNNTRIEKPHYTDNAIAFFRAFEPLDELSVAGSLEPKILDAILTRHGLTLQKLSLSPNERYSGTPGQDMPMIFGKEHVLQIQAQCPALQELAMPVKRMKSNALDVEIYRIFGRMERLQFLFLALDCSNWRVTQEGTSLDDPSFDEYDRRFCGELESLKRGHLRELYINCAVDEMLARSIWETICQGKVGKPLESLKLWTRGGN